MKIDWNKILDELAHLGAFLLWFLLWCIFAAAVAGPQLTFWSMAKEDVGWGLLAFACIIVCGFAAVPMWRAQKELFRFFNGK